MSGFESPTSPREITLLTAIKIAGDDGIFQTLCFGNILELGSDSVVLESKRELEVGDLLVLNVVFPGVRRGPEAVVSLGCAVAGVRDSAQLHYDLSIDKMCDEACRQLAEFLSMGRLERAG